MSTRVKIAPIIQEHHNIPGTIEVTGITVGECLDDLVRQYPKARDWLYNQNGLLIVIVSLNNEETISLTGSGLSRPVDSGDEIQIFAIIAGG